jgi:sialidase-1
LASAPAATAWAVDQLEVFAILDDGQLWNRFWDGTSWHDWESMGGELTGTPTASSWGADRIDVFAPGRDGRVWHRWWDGVRWVDWEQL